jgi:hypothetical protein
MTTGNRMHVATVGTIVPIDLRSEALRRKDKF